MNRHCPDDSCQRKAQLCFASRHDDAGGRHTIGGRGGIETQNHGGYGSGSGGRATCRKQRDGREDWKGQNATEDHLAALPAGEVPLPSTITPSRRVTTRRANLITRGSCVAKTKVVPVSLVESLHDLHDLLAVLGIQVGRRLIGQDHARTDGEGARHGDALLLSAAQLIRAMVCPVGEADRMPAFRPPAGAAPRRRRH